MSPRIVLIRPIVSLFAACSAATGYFVAGGRPDIYSMIAVFSVFLLAGGASALNQYQDRRIDALMQRTGNRPLPAKTLTPLQALFISTVLIFAGLALLSVRGLLPMMLGLAAIIWYNGVYTRLKRHTAFAALPGALVGAIPPAIGWASAGGNIFDLRLSMLCTLFFLWQVPHAWLIMLSHDDDYKKAGMPSMVSLFGHFGLRRIVFSWLSATVVFTLFLPLWKMINSALLVCGLVTACIWLIIRSRLFYMAYNPPILSRSIARAVNIYILYIMLTLSADAFYVKH